jgi:hypothetical protein
VSALSITVTVPWFPFRIPAVRNAVKLITAMFKEFWGLHGRSV